MHLQLFPLSISASGVVYTVAGIAAAGAVISELSEYYKLDRIPTVGSSSWLESLWAARKFKSNGHQLIEEGYKKYKASPFKVAETGRWLVIVSSLQHIEELRKAPDSVLSFTEAANDYTLGREVVYNPYHKNVIRNQLTRNLGNLYPEIRDEITVAFEDILSLGNSGDWSAVPALKTIQKVVSRVSNRLFVGLPLCRDPDWIDITLRYTLDVMEGGQRMRSFANFMAPILLHFVTDVPRTKKRAMQHLTPIIEERLKLFEEHGHDWNEKPNDLLSWLLEEAPEGPERTVKLLTDRVLTFCHAAIHTSSNSFTHALFFLAENPQYIRLLREEVDPIIEKEGWSKASLAKMRKIDSFMKESQRMVGLGSGLVRLAITDFTFSDGTFVPKGTLVAAPTGPLHLDDEHYEDAHMFNPWRFADMRDEDGEGTKHHFSATSPEYLPFGHGKNACPGRFFAANELKSMLVHIVVAYDVKFEDNKPRPGGIRDGAAVYADPFAKIMFRRRVY